MKADVILKKKEDAVSPVIGVMLMLVVTIVIAAVVAAFAGGLGSDVEMAPTAALDIDAYANGKLKINSSKPVHTRIHQSNKPSSRLELIRRINQFKLF